MCGCEGAGEDSFVFSSRCDTVFDSLFVYTFFRFVFCQFINLLLLELKDTIQRCLVCGYEIAGIGQFIFPQGYDILIFICVFILPICFSVSLFTYYSWSLKDTIQRWIVCGYESSGYDFFCFFL